MLMMLRDPVALAPVGEIEAALDWDLGEDLWSAGDWSVVMPTDSRAGQLVLQRPGLGIQVVDPQNNKVLYGGRGHVDINAWDASDETITLAGVDDHGRLASLPVWSDPNDPVATWDQFSRTYVGFAAGPVFETMVAEQIGPTSLRPMNGLFVATGSTAGNPISATVDGQTFLDVFSTHGRNTDVRPRLRQTENGKLVFSAGAIGDKTDLVFTTQVGVEKFKRTRSGPSCTHVIVKSTDANGDPVYTEVAATPDPNWPDRVEHWIDARGETDPTAVGENYLLANRASVSIDVLTISEDSSGAIYKTDFDMGDLVTVELPHQERDAGGKHRDCCEKKQMRIRPRINVLLP